MHNEKKSRGCRLLLLSQAGILGSVAEMLDVETLEMVICEIDGFCHSIPMTVVERMLTQLFGPRWRCYYDAFVSCAQEQSVDIKRPVSVFQEPNTRHLKRRLEHHPWGLGYDMHFPPDTSMINGYVVMMAIRTLASIARNCAKYDYSFIPGEPSECSVKRVSFVENGRLVWITYQPDSHSRHRGASDRDLFNVEKNYTLRGNRYRYARLEGQIPLQDDAFSHLAVELIGDQEINPTEVSGFQNELWDIGAAPRPRCLWSSLWDATFPKSHLNVYDHVLPLTTFDLECCHGFLLPSMRGVMVTFANDVAPEADPSCFRQVASRDPLRFVKCPSTLAVIDLLHLELMQFRGVKELRKSRLSNGSRYLGAVAHVNESELAGIYLAIWSIAVSMPSLVWDAGVKLLCHDCDWFIDHDWLVIACCTHGIKAYRLTLPSPRAIDLTPFVPQLNGKEIFLKVCGVDSDVIACDSPATKSFRFVKLREHTRGQWHAVPIYLPGNISTGVGLGATRLRFNTCSYIHKIGKRYCLTTTGELFDLSSTGMPRGTAENATVTIGRVDTKSLKVIAIWEYLASPGAIIACYDAHKTEPILTLLSLDTFGQQRPLKTRDEPILYRDIQLAIFSPNGRTLFVSSNKAHLGGWVILIDEISRTLQHAYCIRKLPRFVFSERHWHATYAWPELNFPVFLTKDTVAIVNNKITTAGDRIERRNASYTLYDSAEPRVILAQIDDSASVSDCSSMNGYDHELAYTSIGPPRYDELWFGSESPKRIYYDRWIDELRRKPRDQKYCASITYVGKRAALSPGHRFLLYATDRDLENRAIPTIEMRDLTSEAWQQPLRRSDESFRHCLMLRRDFTRVDIYKNSDCPPEAHPSQEHPSQAPTPQPYLYRGNGPANIRRPERRRKQKEPIWSRLKAWLTLRRRS